MDRQLHSGFGCQERTFLDDHFLTGADVDGLDLAGETGAEGDHTRTPGSVNILEHTLTGEGFCKHLAETATASFHLHIGTHPYHGAPLGYHLFAAFQIAHDNGKSAALNFITHRSYPPCFIVMLLIPVRPACSLSELAPVLLRSSWSSVGTGRYQFGFWCFAPDSGTG